MCVAVWGFFYVLAWLNTLDIFKSLIVNYKYMHFTPVLVVCVLFVSTTDNHSNCNSPWLRAEPARLWCCMRKRSHAAAAFHNVCKYCFLIKQCCESQELSTRVSETFREVNNTLGFSSLKLKSHAQPKRKQNNIKDILLYLYFYISVPGGKQLCRDYEPKHSVCIFTFIQMFIHTTWD